MGFLGLAFDIPACVATIVATVLLALVSFDVPYNHSRYILKASVATATNASAAVQLNTTVLFGALGYCAAVFLQPLPPAGANATLANFTFTDPAVNWTCSPPHVGYTVSNIDALLGLDFGNASLPASVATLANLTDTPSTLR